MVMTEQSTTSPYLVFLGRPCRCMWATERNRLASDFVSDKRIFGDMQMYEALTRFARDDTIGSFAKQLHGGKRYT